MMKSLNYFNFNILKVITLLIISGLFYCNIIYATPHYVNKNAAGLNNGTSWANAWTSFNAINWGSISAGDYIFVSGGNDSTTYTAGLTIGKSGSAGNYIYIMAGKYSPSPSGHSGRVVIRPSGAGFTVDGDDYIYIKGFEIQNGSFRGFYCYGGTNNLVIDSVTVENCADMGVWFEECSYVEIKKCSIISRLNNGGAADDNGYGQRIHHFYIHHNYFHMRNGQYGGGTNHLDNFQIADWGYSIYIYNNVCLTDSGVQGHNFILGCKGNTSNYSDTVFVFNNFLYNGGDPGCNYQRSMYFRYPEGGGYIYQAYCINNTIVTANWGAPVIDGEGGRVYSSNNIFVNMGVNRTTPGSCEGGNWTWGQNGTSSGYYVRADSCHSNLAWRCYNANPQFAGGGFVRTNGTNGTPTSWSDWVSNYGGDGVNDNPDFAGNWRLGKYELSVTSPAIDAGTDVTYILNKFSYLPGIDITTDIEGNPRNDGHWDIGAYEFTNGGGGNSPPNQPSNPNPINGATGRPVNLTMTWTCTDPDGDPLTYDVYFGTNSNPPIASTNRTSASFTPGQLNNNTTYYWKIIAKDNQGHSTFGTVWNFTTQTAVVNNPPNPPSNPNPANGSTGKPVNLTMTWTCTDPDGDPLTYDVYFGTNSNPPIASTNRTSASFTPGQLNNNTTYYWKIVAKDNQGHSTTGTVWNFKTIYLDTTPPEVVNITVTSAKNVTVSFSEKLKPANAKNKNNYLISNNVIINSVSLLPDSSSVLIKTSTQQRNREYSITMTNISDKAGNYTNPNPNVVSYFLPRRGPGYMIIIPVNKVIANNFDMNFLPEKTVDGRGMESPDSRWQSSTIMPDTLIFDFGNESSLDSLRISFYEWQSNRIYKYSVNCSVDSIKWRPILKNVWSEAYEWTEIEFDLTSARYVELILLESNENTMTSIWEIEFYGPDRLYKMNNGTESPSSFMISQNYPNPFNPSTTFSYSIAKQSKVLIRIYDITGNEIETLVNEEKPVGTYELTWNANNLPSGVYFYQLQAGDFIDTKKMILMK